MLKASIVESKLFRLVDAFRGSAVDDHDVGNLFKFDVESQGVSFDIMKVAVADEITVAFIFLVVKKLLNQARVWLE